MSSEISVHERYAAAAHASEPALCCPINYDAKYLEVIPSEVIEKDYGCGDPSRYLESGETVLDLGSGTGKICFIASQIVGAEGRVIGIDMTDEMLDVARRNAPVVADRIGFANVEFRKGRIQDLALDLEKMDDLLEDGPVQSARDWVEFERRLAKMRVEEPLVASESIDVVVSNCVLNLVESGLKPQLFRELHRVLKRGGRAVISDIVCDEEVPSRLQEDGALWSGCISGALTEEAFLAAFEDAGFSGIEFLAFEANPWQTVEGIEFRSVTVQAWKLPKEAGRDRSQAVIYKGPFREVIDDSGRRLRRGRREAVGASAFARYGCPAYAGHFEFLDPRETKGAEHKSITETSECCGPAECC